MTSNLERALDYLSALTRARLTEFLGGTPEPLPQISFTDQGDPFTRFIQEKRLSVSELVALTTALAPYIRPGLFDEAVAELLPNGGDLPALGGVKTANSRYMIPTGETALFLLGGQDLGRRMAAQQLFSAAHFFAVEKVLSIEELKPGDPPMCGRLIPDPDYVDLFLTGQIQTPKFGANFPARRIQTEMEWDDLVLDAHTLSQIRELENWVRYNDALLHDWEMYRKVKPGYRALFFGPPGTGKTLTASLLGKYTGCEVFRVDLSMVISKFIGETEKNLSALFDKAQNKNWILFFDEADAIFSKRTGVRDAHDKYANQEVSYLLQRVEDYPGLTILASNFKSNIDEAFIRRFNAMIYFAPPGVSERTILWEKNIPRMAQLADDVNLRDLAQRYELTGAHIVNIVQNACLRVLGRGERAICADDLLHSIRRELAKEGKSV
ncbi:MAG: ATP-binding protein [Saprospiraceae bacterium]